jgi:hypothetical protein
LESIVVAHPFHPLFGQRLPILFKRRCRVHDLLFVYEAGPAQRVTFPDRWTDRTPDAVFAPRLGPEGLAALAEVVAASGYPRLGHLLRIVTERRQ